MKLFTLYKDETFTKLKLGRYIRIKHKLILLVFTVKNTYHFENENILEVYSKNLQGNYVEMKPSKYIKLD